MRDRGNREALGPGQKSRQGEQSDLIDHRSGAYDRITPKPAHPLKEHATAHEKAQVGADVRPDTEPIDEAVPEGLKRPRKDPVNPHTGREENPTQVPEWSPKE